MSDVVDDAPFAPQTGMPRSRLGRRFVAATATVLTAMLIVYGSRVIHEDSFTVPAVVTSMVATRDAFLKTVIVVPWISTRSTSPGAGAPMPGSPES